MKRILALFLLVYIFVGVMGQSQFNSYEELRQKAIEMLKEEKVKEAAELFLLEQDNFPDKQFNITINLAMIYKELNEDEKIIDVLLDGNKRGVIYHINYDSPNFKYLENNERYIDFLEKNIQLRKNASELAKTEILVIAPDDWKEQNYSLMIALHGGMGTNEQFKEQWITDKMKNNYIIAFIQSSQIFTNNTYYWDNVEKGRKDIDEMIIELNEQYNYDKNNIIIGGFSHGGRMALDYAQHSYLSIKKIITLCPGGDLPNRKFDKYKENKTQIIIITGSNDHSIEFQKKLNEELIEAGINTVYKEFDDMGHMFTNEFYEEIDKHLEEK